MEQRRLSFLQISTRPAKLPKLVWNLSPKGVQLKVKKSLRSLNTVQIVSITSHLHLFLTPRKCTHSPCQNTLWARSSKNQDWSNGPLANPFARSLPLLTWPLAPHYSLWSRASQRSQRSLVHSLTCSLTSLTTSLVGKKINKMAIYSILDQSGIEEAHENESWFQSQTLSKLNFDEREKKSFRLRRGYEIYVSQRWECEPFQQRARWMIEWFTQMNRPEWERVREREREREKDGNLIFTTSRFVRPSVHHTRIKTPRNIFYWGKWWWKSASYSKLGGLFREKYTNRMSIAERFWVLNSVRFVVKTSGLGLRELKSWLT